MNSFISHFKPWLLALAALAAIEVSYYCLARPSQLERNAFLELRFAQEETFQRLVAYEKIIAFEKADPDIIQVGDSSALHGVQPAIVVSHLPGYSYLNLGVATNLGYSGYYNLAKLQLQHSRNARYLVLYTSPMGGVPSRLLWDTDQKLMAPLIYNEFISPLHRLLHLSTVAARRDVTDYLYYLGYRLRQRNARLSSNRGYLAFMSVFRESNGWTRETDVEGDGTNNLYKAFLPERDVNEALDPDVVGRALKGLPKVTDEHFFDWRTLSQVSYFDHVYGAFAELAREHSVKLVVIFNPLPESSKLPAFEQIMDWKAIEAALKRVAERNPDVVFTKLDFWPDEKFSVFSHVSTPFSHESSHRVGRIMKEIVANQHPAPRAQASPTVVPSGIVEIDFSRPYSGYGWTDQAGTTNAFPLQYVGPRNRAWIFTAFAPGSAYTVRTVFRAHDTELTRRIELKANDIAALKVSSGISGEDLYVEWMVPAETVNAYRGWMRLEFDVGGASKEDSQNRRTVSFQRVTATPLSTH